jgi:aerobic-type carbon monoxide dehydrogenase small subunit (CoxS/CutS family)
VSRHALSVNGESREVDCPDDEPLLWVLRDHLGLVGTRFGCGEGECGACTVLLDGRPDTACSIAVRDVRGEVTTVEGLAPANGGLHAVQRALIDEQAGQCGYCLSGIVMRAVYLVDQWGADLTDERVREGLADHLCRCGAHARIIAAILRAAR